MQVVDMDESRLARAKQNLGHIDVVGTTEHYPAFVDVVNQRFDWAVPHEARANVTPTDGADPVHESLRHRIAEDNALDVDLHAYAAELAGARRN
jgi:hypothetical protein